jgi:hypothetical protein
MALTNAEQEQLNKLSAKAQEPGDAPKFSLKEILHQLADTVGRAHLHESIDALDGPDHVEEKPEDSEETDDSDEPNPKPNTVK